MINATPLAPLALPPNLPPSSCFAPLLPLDAADSRAATALSPAQQEFSSLQAWLSAPRTLQLPLHQVECQQEQRGVPCSAYCFRRTSNSGDRGTWVAPYT